MEYNTQRPTLIISEYGRNVQNMILHASSIENREERNTCAQAIINVMGQLNPHLRDVEEFKPKLWAHLFIMSDFKLDVDSPYPIPTPESFAEKPKVVPYPQKSIRFKHYGRTCHLLIEKCMTLNDEDEGKQEFILTIVNMMKKAYLTWNRDSVTDEVILANLNQLSNGQLKLDESLHPRIISSTEVLRSQKQSQLLKKAKPNYKKKKKRN